MQISKHTQLVKIRWVLAEKNAKEQSSSDIAGLPVSVNPAHIIYFTFLCLNHRSFIRIFSNCRFLDQTWPCFNLHVTDPLRTVTEMSEALAEPWPATMWRYWARDTVATPCLNPSSAAVWRCYFNQIPNIPTLGSEQSGQLFLIMVSSEFCHHL